MGRFSVEGSNGEKDNGTSKKMPVSSEDEPLGFRQIHAKKPRFSIDPSAAPQPEAKRGISEQTPKEEESMESPDKEKEPKGQLSFILLDPDVLDCPFCFQPLSVPVFQCLNGHVACPPCCTKMSNRCGNCSLRIGYDRCRAMEKVVESATISCPNVNYGCKDTIHYSKKPDHEKACVYQPCSCPLLACDYVGSSESLYKHFALNHSNCSKKFEFGLMVPITLDINQEHIMLHEKAGGTLFILNHSTVHLGSSLDVVCIGPTSAKRRYSYNLTVTSKDGESSIKLESVADNTPNWIADPPAKKYILVPNDFTGYGDKLKLEVNIWRSL